MGILDKLLARTSTKEKVEESPKDAADQTPDQIKLVQFVKGKIDKAKTQANRIAHEGVWMTNVAYLLGFDGCYYDTQSRSFKPTSRSSNFMARNRVHTNILLPMTQNRVARQCKNPPRYDVLPKSKDEDDREAARLSLEVLNNLWDTLEINRKRIDLMMWVNEIGHSYLKVCWDPTKGEPLVDPNTGERLGGYEGDIRVDVVSAFEVFPDPEAKSFDELQYIIHAKVRSLDYFRTHYTEKGTWVKPEGTWLLSLQYEDRIKAMSTYGPGTMGNMATVMDNSAVEIAYYEKASEKHPEGRTVVIANGILLKDESLPCGEIPFAKFDDIVVGGKYYSESTITHARPLQDQYNRSLVKRAQWLNRMLAGKFLAAKGHGIIKEAYTDQSGEFIEYNFVPNCPPPAYLAPSQMPQYAYEETTQLEGQIAKIFGLSEVSRGIMPSAGIPAIGMQLLLEQDETRIGIEIEQHEYSWARVGRLVLKYVSKFYITERRLKKKGAGNEYDVRYFDGKDLKDNDDVMVVRGSTIPNSKLMKRQEILNAYNNGLLGDPADPAVREKVLGMLEFGDLGDVWRDQALDQAQIQKGLKDIEAGIAPVVSEFDNHVLWCQELNRYRKGDKYEGLPIPNRDILLTCLQEHLDEQVKIMNPQLANPPTPPIQIPEGPGSTGIAENPDMSQNNL